MNKAKRLNVKTFHETIDFIEDDVELVVQDLRAVVFVEARFDVEIASTDSTFDVQLSTFARLFRMNFVEVAFLDGLAPLFGESSLKELEREFSYIFI